MPVTQEQATWFADAFQKLVANIDKAIVGKSNVIRLVLTALVSDGHVLLEDYPGTGKTVLAKALANSLDGTTSRIQFTPDLLPSDVTGVQIYDQSKGKFQFHQGPIFASIVLADEINRASPKTQSALLEVMEEGVVTIDGEGHGVGAPFMVIATQNPIEMEGTYPLPEAQRDRFTARVSMGYPSAAAELDMLDTHGGPAALDDLDAVADASEVRKLIDVVRAVHVSDEVKRYVVDLVSATRTAPELRLGASPRSSLQLLRAARAAAGLEGRDYVLPDDVQALAVPVLAHRLLPTAEAQVARRTTEAVVQALVERLPLPRPTKR